MHLSLTRLMLCGICLSPALAVAQVPTQPAVSFNNSSSVTPGTVIPNLLDSYSSLVANNPAVLVQNYQYVDTATNNRTTAQTLAAIHDDRTAQPYSVTNGLGALTSLYLTGAGASASGTAPPSLMPTVYAPATLGDYTVNINYLNNASAGSATFGNGTATPLAAAVNFINNTVRANSSTEPPKRTFERAMTAGSTLSPLDPRYANYAVTSNPTGLSLSDTSQIVVPSYLSNFAVPTPYANITQWVQGLTVTPAQVAANGGNPITAPNLGTFNAQGAFTPATFGAGAYVPGIGAAPRPYRVDSNVNVPVPLQQVINSTNPYADGTFPSGHTNSAYTQAIGEAFVVPQEMAEVLTRASDLGNNRILAGMHSPLDVIGGRIEAEAITATNIYGALYDSAGNRLDWTNPANTSAYAVYQALNQTQTYLASACGTSSVAACVAKLQPTANDPYSNIAQDKANATARLSYGFQPVSAMAPMVDSQVPLQAQVLLLSRLPYLTDAQRTAVLSSTALPSGFPLLNGNTYDGWGQLNLVAAAGGYGAFSSTVTVAMDASRGGFNAADTWSNDIGGVGGLVKQGTGQLTLTGSNSYSGGTQIQAGRLVAGSQSALGMNDVAVTGGTLVDAVAGTLTIAGALTETGVSTMEFDITGNKGGLATLMVGRAALLNGMLDVSFLNDLAIGAQQEILIQALNGLTGDFSVINVDGISPAYSELIIRTATGYELDITAVPEPATLLLLASGFGALAVLRRRDVASDGS